MKVKWQSDAPNMELVIPKGQYLPYELPVATKEVLGGVKVDGDTINITSDGVISAQKVDLSGVATKVELEEVENKIPDISGLATKSELVTVESKIPDTSGLATKTELTAVENKIPDVSGFATKDEIPNVSGLATKVELNEVAATIPSSDDLATKAELNAVQSSIPDTTGLATKVELSNVEAKIPNTSNFATKVELNNVATNIPETYLKVANLGDGSLTIINNKGESVVFTPAAAGGGGTTEKEWLVITADIGTVEIGEVESYSTLENVSATKEDIKAAYAAGKNILLKLNDTQIMGGIIVCMPFSYTPINDSVDLLLLGTLAAAESFTAYDVSYSMEDDMWYCSIFQIEYLDKAHGDQLYVDEQNTLPTLATKAELGDYALKTAIPDVSSFATTNYVETAITNKGYQTQTQVQALINNAISNIKNANEVSY